MKGVTAFNVSGRSRLAVGTTSSMREIACLKASRASSRLLSMGVLRLRVSYERIYGAGPDIQSMRRAKWSRACRKCFPAQSVSTTT